MQDNIDTVPPPAIRESFRFVGDVGPLFEALAKAQAEFVEMERDSEVGYENAKGRRAFRYASLAEVLASVRPALNRHGLALLQPFDGNEVVSMLCLGAARFEVSVMLPEWKTVQDLGSALTYVKRYQLKSLLGVNDGEDDDGNAAAGTGRQPEPVGRTRTAPPVAQAPKQPVGDLAKPDTVKRVIELSRKVGHKGKEELDEFSRKAGCGPLAEQTDINALRLIVALEKLQVQP